MAQQKEGGSARLVFTIGHSNHERSHFLALLQEHRIDSLIDVRSQPYSKYTTWFNGPELRAALERAGVRYVFLGRELGGRPDGDEFYDADGHVRYDRVAASPRFQDGLRQIQANPGGPRLALMCGEEDPIHCHRRLLVGRVLGEQGVTVQHIRGDGRVEAEEDVQHRDRRRPDENQMLLFDDAEESEWKSTQSVSPKRLRANSSEP